VKEEIARALESAFPERTITDADLTPITGGRSGATVLGFTAEERRWILRKKNPQALGNELECLRIASEIRVAPPVRFVDRASGVCIMEHVDALPARAPREDVARAVRRLHDGPPFPQGPTLPEMAPMVRQYIPDDVAAAIDELGKKLATSGRRAPCHRDLNPMNVLTTERGVLFVDWDTASQDDPFLDVAELGAFTPVAEARDALFATYLDRAPTDAERAELQVARVLALAFYTAASTVGHVLGGGASIPFGDDAPPLESIFVGGKAPAGDVMARAFYRQMKIERAAL
jgi:hypothetical protein